MKPGTIEYQVRTERKYTGTGPQKEEHLETEYWFKIRGHDSDDTFDPENVNTGLVEKLRQQNIAVMMGNSNLLRHSSSATEMIPTPGDEAQVGRDTE